MDEHPEAYVFGFLGLGISLFQIASLCLIGQWLTTKSADLLDASYECAWYNQSNSFKKTLMTLRMVCQRDVTFGAVRFDFSNASFYRVLRFNEITHFLIYLLFISADYFKHLHLLQQHESYSQIESIRVRIVVFSILV